MCVFFIERVYLHNDRNYYHIYKFFSFLFFLFSQLLIPPVTFSYSFFLFLLSLLPSFLSFFFPFFFPIFHLRNYSIIKWKIIKSTDERAGLNEDWTKHVKWIFIKRITFRFKSNFLHSIISPSKSPLLFYIIFFVNFKLSSSRLYFYFIFIFFSKVILDYP